MAFEEDPFQSLASVLWTMTVVKIRPAISRSRPSIRTCHGLRDELLTFLRNPAWHCQVGASWTLVMVKRFCAAGCPTDPRLRKTSPIAWFSQSLREIVTSSGRRYELVGPPATDPESLVLMAWHLEASGCDVADEIADITSLYWGAITGATH